MINFILTQKDTLEDFRSGLADIGPFDCVSEHENRFGRTLLLGRSLAWGNLSGIEIPLVIGWRARIRLPGPLLNDPITTSIQDAIRRCLNVASGRWMVDIRTEARSLPDANVLELVLEDIERGELPNRLLFERGVRHVVLEQIGRLQSQVGIDSKFDWRRVRLKIDAVQ